MVKILLTEEDREKFDEAKENMFERAVKRGVEITKPPKKYLEILKNPNLFNLITETEFDKKVVGEIDARKTIFLVTCMRLVENLNKATDNLIINAKSGTGKDCITEAIFEFIPENEKEELLRISPKVLAYTRNRIFEPESSWKKVCLRLEDVTNSVLIDDGFKVMLSSNPNKINRAKIVWRGKVIPFEIEGKPSICMTIANPNPKEENLRRSPTCFLDEGRNQTKEILIRQAEYAKKGVSTEYDEDLLLSLKFLKRNKVKIPFADKLIQIFNPEDVIVRTHFPRFLDYIKASCSFHQYQRKKDKQNYLIAQKEDYEIARTALIKTTTNILMIPTTKLQDNILKCFENNNIQNKSVDEISEFKEIEKLNISNEWLRKQMDWLVSKTFLLKAKEKRTDESGKIIPKPVFVYSYNKMKKLEVPHFDTLISSSNTSNNKNTSFSSNTSDTPLVNEVNEVNDLELPKRHFELTKESDFKTHKIKPEKI